MLTLQALINGLTIGAGFGLLGLPVVLIFRSSRVVNFAIGGLVVWAGLLGNSLLQGRSMLVAYPALLGICVLGSVLLYLVCMRFALGKSQVLGVMVGLAVGFALEGLAAVFYGADSRGLRRVVPRQTFEIVDGRLSISSDSIVAVIVLAVVFLILRFVIHRSRFGREIRAVSDDPTTAAAVGINVHRVLTQAYAVLGVGVFAATLVIIPTQAINAFQGFPLLLGTMIGVSIGGMERVEGAVVGGLIVGVVTSVAITMLNPFAQSVALVALLAVVLGIRPEGIFIGLRGRDVA